MTVVTAFKTTGSIDIIATRHGWHAFFYILVLICMGGPAKDKFVGLTHYEKQRP